MAAASSASSAASFSALVGILEGASSSEPDPPLPPPPKNDVMPGPDNGNSRSLLRGWLRRGRRRNPIPGWVVAEDVREDLEDRRSMDRRSSSSSGRRRRHRATAMEGLGARVVIPRIRSPPAAPSARHRRRPRSGDRGSDCGGRRAADLPRCLEQPPLSQPRGARAPAQHFHSSRSRRPRRRLLRAGRHDRTRGRTPPTPPSASLFYRVDAAPASSPL